MGGWGSALPEGGWSGTPPLPPATPQAPGPTLTLAHPRPEESGAVGVDPGISIL